MAGYGYTYQRFSTYNNVRDESRGPVIKPFDPFVLNTNSNSEGNVTTKTIVPVAGRPYGDDYPARSDGSPDKVDEFLTKVQNEASRPARFNPVTSSDWRLSPQPTTYNGANGNNKEGRKPVGGNIRNDNYDGYNGTNGYSDYGNYGSKEGRKPIGSTIRNDNYDGYNGPNGYGDYGNIDRHRPAEKYSVTKPNKIIPGDLNRPKISTAWGAAPRKGTQLSEPTNDIEKAMELLKEAARLNDHSNKGGHNATKTALPYDNYDDYQHRHDEDSRDATRQSGGNYHFLSRPRTPPSHVSFVDGREADYRDIINGRDDKRRYGNTSIIDSKEAEKKYKGKRV